MYTGIFHKRGLTYAEVYAKVYAEVHADTARSTIAFSEENVRVRDEPDLTDSILSH